MELKPLQFIDETVEARFDAPPMLEKKPGCPDGFMWCGQAYRVAEMLSEWHDYRRRGRMANNMQPQHAAVAVVGRGPRLLPRARGGRAHF